MGASNVLAAFRLYAGRVPSTSLVVLVYMATVARDRDAEPWWSQGHDMLAIQCLGRTPPEKSPDLDKQQQKERDAILRAVERAITPLFEIGAITTVRHSWGRGGRLDQVRYRLWLTQPAPDEKRRTLATSTRRKVSEHPTESVGAPDGKRRTKEYEEKEERDHAHTGSHLRDLEGRTAAQRKRELDQRLADITSRRPTAHP